MNAGSCAAEHYEPRQVREEAAVNSSFWVPQVHLVGACGRDKPLGVDRQRVHDLIKCKGFMLAYQISKLYRITSGSKYHYILGG